MVRINGVEAWNTAEELLDPGSTAVLVIDMQNEAASSKGGYTKHGYDISRIRSIIPTIQKVLEAGRRLNLLVAYTEFVHRDRQGVSLMDGPNVYLHCKEEWVSDVTDGTWEAKTVDELVPLPGEVVIQKSRASAIYHTYLENILRHRGIRSLVLMGCLSDGCVLKTAVDLTEHGYYPVVVTDGVESLTAEKHDIGMKYMEMKFPLFSSNCILKTWGHLSEEPER